MDDRQTLLLAYGISEYENAIRHLSILRVAGVVGSFTSIGRLQTEQRLLIARWLAEHGDAVIPPSPDDTVADVRTWLAQHVEELDQVLREEGLNP